MFTAFLRWYLAESNCGHKDFQSFALPTELRYRLFEYSGRDLNPHGHYCPLDFKSNVSTNSTTRACQTQKKRAKDGIRTRDIHLGKVVLYQLSYFRFYFASANIKPFYILKKFFYKKILFFFSVFITV